MLVDMHTHVLPSVDDGSKSVAESIAMLRMEARQHIDCVVATPHFYARYDRPEEFFARRKASMATLREELLKHPDLPEVKLGAEVYFFPGMSESAVLQDLAIEGGNCVLVEMPMSTWTDQMYRELEGIYAKQGLIPVIAHLDRYIKPFRAMGVLRKLEELPVLVQANASFFLQRSTINMAMRMLRRNQIHLLGSDCHNMAHRKPYLGEAVGLIHQRLGSEIMKQIAENQDIVFRR